MFFLARAAVCIGLVAVAASNVGGADLASAVDRGVQGAAKVAGQACLRSVECLRMGAGVLTAAPLLTERHDGGSDGRDVRGGFAAEVPLPPQRPLL